jgi:hypothetical protein
MNVFTARRMQKRDEKEMRRGRVTDIKAKHEIGGHSLGENAWQLLQDILARNE